MSGKLRKLSRRLLFRRGPPEVVQSVRRESLSYLGTRALTDLFQLVEATEDTGRPGCLIECGCALGGSGIVIGSAKAKGRLFYVYDVFGMIPAPSKRDGPDVQRRYLEIVSGQSAGIGGDRYYGYEEDLMHMVAENFRNLGVPVEENNVHLVRGLFQETLKVDGPVAFAHIDSDWYEPVSICLQRIVPHLVRGGALVIDDYNTWSGCRKAVDEYFQDRKADYRFIRKARLHIVRR